MSRLSRVPAVLAAVFVGVLLSACGGGGGGAINSNVDDANNNDQDAVTLPSQEKTAKFTAEPNQTTVQTVGDLSIVVPAGTVSTATTVTVSRSQPSTLPQFDGFVAAKNPELSVSFANGESGQIEIKPLTQPASRGISTTVWGYLTGKVGQWHLACALSAVTLTAMVEADKVLSGIIGSFVVSPIDPTTNLVKLATNPAGNEFSALILVHGFNSRVEDMELAASKLNGYLCEDEPSVIYGFEYDYRQHCSQSAQQLAKLIDDLPYANITILAHSAGVVVTRDMIENGRCRSDHYLNATLVDGANFGSFWANGADFARTLEEGVLNEHPASASSLLALTNDPIISDLVRGSTYLAKLNRNTPQQPAYASYLLIGSSDDAVVGVDSGLGTDIAFETKVRGSVNRMTSFGGHSDLIETSAGLDALLPAIYHDWGSFFWVTTDPEYDAYADTDGWYYHIVLDNSEGSDDVVVDDIAADIRDSSNASIGYLWLQQWGQFQSEYTRLGKLVPAGETSRISVYEPLGTPTNRSDWLSFDRAYDLTVRYTINGRQLCWLPFIRFHAR